MDFKAAFERALPYAPFVEKYGTEAQQARWRAMYDQVALSDAQQALLRSFVRRMNVLVLAGVWCGDCVNACPIWQRFAEACPALDMRFIHRPMHFDPQDPSPDTALANELRICGGPRVPVLVFLSEDWYECERFGERTLATYRSKVANAEGLSCPIGLVPPQDLLAANVAEWLEHFERVQLMLLTSPRLMQLHS
ncbi:MAG: thioredoxin family protein [Candidatus Xenobia bacterium]